jgi:hypothetical protein
MSVYASAVSEVKHVALVPEVQHALLAWIKSKVGTEAPGVLIGGLAMSFYAKPRYTEDVDLLFLSKALVPTEVKGFKRYRPGAFQENKTQVDIELTTPASIELPIPVAKKVIHTAVNHDGILVASKEAMVVLKLFGANTLKREFKDLNDIVSILSSHPDLILEGWEQFLTEDQLSKFNDAKRRAGS